MKTPLRVLLLSMAIMALPALSAEVTLDSLFRELTDFTAVARWPEPEFTCKQASSYDRATVAPEKPGWFANNDQNQFIRAEVTGANQKSQGARIFFGLDCLVLERPVPAGGLGPFVKHPEPVLKPSAESKFHCPVLGQEVRWEERNVYNPAAVVRDSKVYLFYRADDRNSSLQWGRTCHIGMAWSEDGTNFTRHPTPVLYPACPQTPAQPFQIHAPAPLPLPHDLGATDPGPLPRMRDDSAPNQVQPDRYPQERPAKTAAKQPE